MTLPNNLILGFFLIANLSNAAIPAPNTDHFKTNEPSYICDWEPSPFPMGEEIEETTWDQLKGMCGDFELNDSDTQVAFATAEVGHFVVCPMLGPCFLYTLSGSLN